MVEAIFGIMGSQSLLHLGALSLRLSMGSIVYWCMFCDVQLCLVSCSCEYCSSVPSYLVSIARESRDNAHGGSQ